MKERNKRDGEKGTGQERGNMERGRMGRTGKDGEYEGTKEERKDYMKKGRTL